MTTNREATEFIESITDEQWEFIADHRPDLIRRLLATAKTERADATDTQSRAMDIIEKAAKRIEEIGDPLAAAQAENEKLLEALTPSAATKHAYIGEFYFDTEMGGYDEDGEHTIMLERVQVPWTTIKEIMAAIRARALKQGD